MGAASLVGLLTAWSALWGAWAEMARQQKEAVATIQNLGGQVMYDYQKVEGGKLNVYDPKALPRAPKKLREALGDDFFRVVVFVSFRGTPVIDEDLKQLKKLPNLALFVKRLLMTVLPLMDALISFALSV